MNIVKTGPAFINPVANASEKSLLSPAWKIATFHIPGVNDPIEGEIHSIAVSEEIGLTAVCSREGLFVIDSGSISNGQLLRARKVRSDLFFPDALSFSPDGSFLAGQVSRSEEKFELLRADALAEGRAMRQAKMALKGLITVSAWSPDGNFLAVGDYDGTTTVFDVSEVSRNRITQVAKFTRRYKLVGIQSSTESISFSPDSSNIVICYGDGVIRFVSLKNPKAGDETLSLSTGAEGEMIPSPGLPALPQGAAWWKALKTRRSWLPVFGRSGELKAKLEGGLHSLRGSLGPDGTSMAVAGDAETFHDACQGKGWQEGKKVENTAVRLLDLTDIDNRGRPVPKEIASLNMQQTIHSVIFLADGVHILVTTQSCGTTTYMMESPHSFSHIKEADRTSGDPELLSQIKLLRIERAKTGAELVEVGALGLDCTWVLAGASRSGRTICAGTYEADGFIFQAPSLTAK